MVVRQVGDRSAPPIGIAARDWASRRRRDRTAATLSIRRRLAPSPAGRRRTRNCAPARCRARTSRAVRRQAQQPVTVTSPCELARLRGSRTPCDRSGTKPRSTSRTAPSASRQGRDDVKPGIAAHGTARRDRARVVVEEVPSTHARDGIRARAPLRAIAGSATGAASSARCAGRSAPSFHRSRSTCQVPRPSSSRKPSARPEATARSDARGTAIRRRVRARRPERDGGTAARSAPPSSAAAAGWRRRGSPASTARYAPRAAARTGSRPGWRRGRPSAPRIRTTKTAGPSPASSAREIEAADGAARRDRQQPVKELALAAARAAAGERRARAARPADNARAHARSAASLPAAIAPPPPHQ